jgi:hypothetical protein
MTTLQKASSATEPALAIAVLLLSHPVAEDSCRLEMWRVEDPLRSSHSLVMVRRACKVKDCVDQDVQNHGIHAPLWVRLISAG